jgi:hypothetical protein
MDVNVGVKNPFNNTGNHLLLDSNIPQKYYVQLFPRTKQNSKNEKYYMLEEVLRGMLSNEMYIKSKQFLKCLKKGRMSDDEFNNILTHFLSIDNNVYDVIIKLGIFTPFHYIAYNGSLPRISYIYHSIIVKLGYDPIVLGGKESPYYLSSIASVFSDYNAHDPIFLQMQPCLYNDDFIQNIKCEQILNNLHMCTYSSPNYVTVVSWIDVDDKQSTTPAGFEGDVSRLNEDGLIMYKNKKIIRPTNSNEDKCSTVTLLQLYELLMILLDEIEPQRITESNDDYYTRIDDYNIEFSRMFTVTNVTYEIARYFGRENNINIDIMDPVGKIIYDNGRYIKHAKYIEELISGTLGLLNDYYMNIRNILQNSEYNKHYKVLWLKSHLEVHKYEILYGANKKVSISSPIEDVIDYINKSYVSNPVENFWIMRFLLNHDFDASDEKCHHFVHLNLDNQIKKALMHNMFLIRGGIFPNKYIPYGIDRIDDFVENVDSEFYLYCYNIMRKQVRGMTFQPNDNLYIQYICNQGGPEKWQEQLILCTQIEKKGFGLLSTLVKDVRMVIVEYLLGKSFLELSYEEKYYYSSIYNGERFIY